MKVEKLKGKKIVILGGTSGLGLSAAKAAAAEGAHVVVCSRHRANVDKALLELPPNAEGAALDVTDEDAPQQFFAGQGGLDHLIYCAGDALPASVSTTAKARNFFEVRFWGIYMATKAAFPHVRPGGSITLTNGILAQRPWKGWSAVSALAGAVEALTRGLALEMAPIRVNAVCAGVVRTALWGGMDETARDAMYAQQAGALPLGRVGEADDIAEAYLYLMKSDFSTGQVVAVDGGALIA